MLRNAFPRARRSSADSDVNLFRLAEIYFSQGKFDLAERQARLAIAYGGSSNPNRWASAHELLGRIKWALGDRAEAERPFKVADSIGGNISARLFLSKLAIED